MDNTEKNKQFLSKLSAELRKHFYGVTGIDGVFYAGSASHNELVFHEDSNQLISDVEIGVVTNPIFHRMLVRKVARKLSLQLNTKLDAFCITRYRLKYATTKNFSLPQKWSSVFAYEISHGAQWVFQKRNLEIKNVAIQDIHSWEALRLVLNRFGECSKSIIALVEMKREICREDQYYLNKMIMACGDALLLARKRYVCSYQDRLINLENLFAKNELPAELQECLVGAYRYRLGTGGDCHSISREQLMKIAGLAIRESLYRLNLTDSGDLYLSSNEWCHKLKLPLPYNFGSRYIFKVINTVQMVVSAEKSYWRLRDILMAWRGSGIFLHWAFWVLYVKLLVLTKELENENLPFLASNEENSQSSVQNWWIRFCR